MTRAEGRHPELLEDKWVIWSNLQHLTEELLSDVGVVSEAVLKLT